MIFYGLFVIGLSYLLNQNSEADYYEHRDDPREETARSMLKHLRSEDSTKREALGNFKIYLKCFFLNSFNRVFLHFEEKLRDEHYRNKYWKKYFGATDNDTHPHYNKRHKVLEYEAKKIQEIDRKLKSYSLRNQKGDKQHQRPDLSPSLNSGRINSNSSHHKTLLLHDASRFDSSYVHNNHSTLNSYNNRRHSSHPFFVNKIWINDSKSQKPEALPTNPEVKSIPIQKNFLKVQIFFCMLQNQKKSLRRRKLLKVVDLR